MEFDKIKIEIKKIEPETTRMDNENYFEAVVGKSRLEGVIQVLESIFGAPAWPSEKKLLKNIEKLVKNMGGLREGQTLYLLDKEECSAFVMLWPWQDGERVTIKISKI